MKNTSRTDWARIDAMTEAEIDTSDIPPLPEDFFETAQRRDPVGAGDDRLVLLHLEPTVYDWFQAQGNDYQEQMKRALRQYAEAHSQQTQKTAA